MPICGLIGIKYFAGKLTSLSSVANDWFICQSCRRRRRGGGVIVAQQR